MSTADYEQVRDTVQQLGDDSIAAAADALGVTGDLPGRQQVTAVSCSGAPDGYVQLTVGTSLLYPAGSAPADADAAIQQAWTDLGLEVERRRDSLVGSTSIGSVATTVGLSDPVDVTDGSGRVTRSLGAETRCFDVGADLARELTR